MSPLRGQGQKEPDGNVRKFPVYCRLPIYKVELIDRIAKDRGISRTDIISESIDLWLSENAEYTEETINISTEN